MINKTLTNPQSKQKLQSVMEDIMNDNLARYRKPITLANYQKKYDPNKKQAANNRYNDDATILELLNVIENKLIKLIQTDFYS